jgi:hypothetical protein
MPIVLRAFVEQREPDVSAYTYQEIQERAAVRQAHHLAPDPPRQSEAAPRKLASMPIAFFYHLVFRGGAHNQRWRFNGSHMIIDRLGQSGIPRGKMITPIGAKRPTRRRNVASYGTNLPTI